MNYLLLILVLILMSFIFFLGMYAQKKNFIRLILQKYFYFLMPGFRLQRNTPPENYLSLESEIGWKDYQYTYQYEELNNFLHKKANSKNLIDKNKHIFSNIDRDDFIKNLYGDVIKLVDHKSFFVKSSCTVFQSDDYQIKRLLLNGRIDGISVDLLIGIPNKITQKQGIIALHGFSSSPEKIMGLAKKDYSNSIGLEFIKKGFVVAAPFIFNHGDRLSSSSALASMVDTTIEAISVANVISSIDYVSKAYGINNFGIYGISAGATISLYAGAIEDRISCVAASGILQDRIKSFSDLAAKKGQFTNRGSKLYTHYFFSKYPFYYKYSFSVISKLICPKPLLIENGSDDGYLKYYGAELEFVDIQDYYQKKGAEKKATFKTFEGSHEANIGSTLEWMLKNLNQ